MQYHTFGSQESPTPNQEHQLLGPEVRKSEIVNLYYLSIQFNKIKVN